MFQTRLVSWIINQYTLYVQINIFIYFQDESICTYCEQKFGTDTETIAHCIRAHPQLKVSFLTYHSDVKIGNRVQKKYKRKSFDVAGKDIRGDTSQLSYTSENAFLRCPRTPECKSPMDKVQRDTEYRQQIQ